MTLKLRSIGSKSVIFLSRVTLKFDGWPRKQQDNSFILFQALCIISYPSVNSKWSYSPETPDLGQNRVFFEPCDLEIWRMTLSHWGRVTHICVDKLTIIGSDNGLSPGQRQAIIWTKAGILLIWPLGTNFSEIIIEIDTFSFKKIHLKMPSAKWHPICVGLNVLKTQ